MPCKYNTVLHFKYSADELYGNYIGTVDREEEIRTATPPPPFMLEGRAYAHCLNYPARIPLASEPQSCFRLFVSAKNDDLQIKCNAFVQHSARSGKNHWDFHHFQVECIAKQSQSSTSPEKFQEICHGLCSGWLCDWFKSHVCELRFLATNDKAPCQGAILDVRYQIIWWLWNFGRSLTATA